MRVSFLLLLFVVPVSVKLEEKVREDISEAFELLEHKIRQTDSEATRIRLATVKELKP
jgi:hypothetical protein